jgi:hypothetical protein
MTNAKILQLTNAAIGAIAVNGTMPLGVATVVYPFDTNNCYPTYTVASSTSDTLVINKPGTYRITYNVSAIGGAAGDITLAMKVNGVSKYTVSTSLADAGVVNLTIPFEVYVPCNCANSPNNVPASIQI